MTHTTMLMSCLGKYFDKQEIKLEKLLNKEQINHINTVKLHLLKKNIQKPEMEKNKQTPYIIKALKPFRRLKSQDHVTANKLTDTSFLVFYIAPPRSTREP